MFSLGSWIVFSFGFDVRLRFLVDRRMDDLVGCFDGRDAEFSLTPKPETRTGLVELEYQISVIKMSAPLYV